MVFVDVLKATDEKSRSASGSGSAYGSVSHKYGSEDLDPHPDPYHIFSDP